MKLKIVISSSLFFIFYFLFFIFAPKANAQFPSASGRTNANYLNTNPDVPQNFHTYTQSVFIEIAAAVSCQLSGIDPINPAAKCLGMDPKTGKIGFVEGGGGAIGMLGNLLAATFYIPVSTHDYGSYIASNFGITKSAYAQGVGFIGLKPTLSLWQAFRNVTYLIFVIMFIIVGLGIMFRIRIDPRTVMTIQNQIPKIIIALVLVTFSYAIAGFLIDLMYVSMYLIISVFDKQGIDPVNITASNPFSAAGGLGGISGVAGGVAATIAGIVASIFDGTTGTVIAGIVSGIIGGFLGGQVGGDIPFIKTIGGGKIIGTLIGGVGLGGLGAAFGNELLGLFARVIAYLVIIIAVFSALLRLWFVLIKSYIYILITVVLAPFYIASGLIPGRSGFGTWVRSILSNLVVFPVTIALLLMGKAFIAGFSGGGNRAEPPFVPPMVGDFSNPERFASIIGLGIILLLPEVANMARDALKAPDLKYTAAIGRSVAGGAGVITGSVRGTAGAGFAAAKGTMPPPGEAGIAAVIRRLFR